MAGIDPLGCNDRTDHDRRAPTADPVAPAQALQLDAQALRELSRF
jgi:hypothetical protein